MKKCFQIALLGLSLVSLIALADENLDLEPCINGEVSASGLFINQEAEEEYYRDLQQADNLELEPCINGEISASGMFPTQEAEDHYLMMLVKGNEGSQMTSTGDVVDK